MRSERQEWRKAVRNWERRVNRIEQGLEDSKVSATDLVGERPDFHPSQDYRGRISEQASHLVHRLATVPLDGRKRARTETQLKSLLTILQETGRPSVD
jgi:hypothetical protein